MPPWHNAERVGSRTAPKAAPVVVVGAGPSGIRAVNELLRHDPRCPIVLYGDEPWEPYQRVQLTALMLGEVGLQAIRNKPALPPGHRVVQRHHCRVLGIDRERRCVRDAAGRWQPYSRLILATGSSPHVPSIPGIGRAGVYAFRNLDDVQRLLARRARSRRLVVLGGGLLGLEAARALRRAHTEVWLVHHSSRLMNRQLDDGASARLALHVRALGIHLALDNSVREVLGDERIGAVRLRDGTTIECDTLVLATGIQPNVELGFAAGLRVGLGIRVDDRLCTSDPDIYAVGECAEHRGRVYGLVAPGLEQAAIAAHNVLGSEARYTGSQAAAELKVLGLPVFSAGCVGEEENPTEVRSVVHQGECGRYRRLTLRRGRLAGVIAVGDWPELPRVREALLRQRRVWPWQRAAFRRRGALWSSEPTQGVADWPTTAVVCNCAAVTRGALGRAVAEGCQTVESLRARTGAGQVCGSCRPLLAELVGATAQAEPQPGRLGVLGSIAGALVVLAGFLFAAEIPVADTVQGGWQPQSLWLDGFWKQVSGYALLGLGAVASLLSLRKRWKRFTLGAYPWWRLAHVVLGTLAVTTLVVHTGLRLGNHLNFLLIAGFLALTALGAVAGAAVALERAPNPRTRRLRALSGYWHVALLWPLPALLGFHILSVYYF
jgi:nitrite reductase (NADH) large subunit